MRIFKELFQIVTLFEEYFETTYLFLKFLMSHFCIFEVNYVNRIVYLS